MKGHRWVLPALPSSLSLACLLVLEWAQHRNQLCTKGPSSQLNMTSNYMFSTDLSPFCIFHFSCVSTKFKASGLFVFACSQEDELREHVGHWQQFLCVLTVLEASLQDIVNLWKMGKVSPVLHLLTSTGEKEEWVNHSFHNSEAGFRVNVCTLNMHLRFIEGLWQMVLRF